MTQPRRAWRIETASPRMRVDIAIGEALKVGWYVKLLFTSMSASEYVWAKVAKVKPPEKEGAPVRYLGIVQGEPPPLLYLERGALVEFDPENAFDYIDANPKESRR